MDLGAPFFELTRQELADWFEGEGLPRYRADQVFVNVYQRGVTDFQAMTDLPKPLRRRLAEAFTFASLEESRRLDSPGDATAKFLWRLADARTIESVYMQADYGDTICFSTQVGCAFNCSFCITAKMGRIRQLSAGEIVAQVYRLLGGGPRRDGAGAEAGEPGPVGLGAAGGVRAAPNLVAMGMGEPMDNLDAVLKAIAIFSDPKGLNISPRRITLSTVGVVPGIDRLTRENPGVSLALSLNATTDAVRRRLMPVTKKWPLGPLLAAVGRYAAASDRRVTLEYVLIRGLNDTPEDAARLGRIAERFPSKVNLIPFNPSELFPYERPTEAEVDAFARRLWRHRTTVTVRYSKGLDILAACGQLGYDQVKAKIEATNAAPSGSSTGS
jgi:23S rRNA (adenine2503-C2)-methyltransferase